ENFRINILPTRYNGLEKPSQIMCDKIFTIPEQRLGHIIGHLEDNEMIQLDQTLAFVIGL
ncbi:MAG: type II toxin-antitoxin system PemK/MazF family toxin, partial [Bdellovibrionales bacterium]